LSEADQGGKKSYFELQSGWVQKKVGGNFFLGAPGVGEAMGEYPLSIAFNNGRGKGGGF